MDYLSLARKIDEKAEYGKAPANRKVRIALLSSFTIGGIRETLLVKCASNGISPLFFVGPYNQYNQEILNKSSELYHFNPDLVVLLLDTRSVSGERFFQINSDVSEEELHAWASSTVKSVLSLVAQLEQNAPKAKIIVNNLEIPTYSSLGLIEGKQKYSFRRSIEEVNFGLAEAFRSDPRCFVFDYDNFSSKVGKNNSIDYKMYYLGDMRINPRFIPDLCDEYIPYIRAMLSMVKKCLVLDLDGTLWGGVVGEDGLNGIKLGPTPEGQPFVDFQKYIVSLYNKGVILAVNSANNIDDALEVFRKHAYMVLKEDQFASMQINWDNKVSNMKAIAEQVEIGIDSLVFVDDNPMNREVMRQALPEVLTIDFPIDPALFPKTIMNLRVFDGLQLTSEDKVRGKMYAEQRKRQEYQKVVGDITEYLKSLETVVTIDKANKFNIPRISQLTQKTNQFNLTTRRYLEDEISRMASSDNFLVVSLRVEDKFGDSGLTGVAIVEKGNEKWRIDSFLLSCRVLGRQVEETLLAYIIDQAERSGAKVLVGEFIPTKKNAPAKDFLPKRGFTKVETTKEGAELWEYQLEQSATFPMYVKVLVR
jgi:FkbH-like protein